MKCFLKSLTVLGLAISLSSCGLPASAMRTVSNTVKGITSAASGMGGLAGLAAGL